MVLPAPNSPFVEVRLSSDQGPEGAVVSTPRRGSSNPVTCPRQRHLLMGIVSHGQAVRFGAGGGVEG